MLARFLPRAAAKSAISLAWLMTSQTTNHREDSFERGRSLRKVVPRSIHGDWKPAADRPDPVELIEGQNTERIQRLVPVRRARMAETAFTFFRGAARIMAHDLAKTPSIGLIAQICGDAHLSNFGTYASPERELVFDLNDFDETLQGPWEWDVKRLAASFVIAGQDQEMSESACREIVEESMTSYRSAMRRFSEMTWLEAWYQHLSLDDLADLAAEAGVSKQRRKRLDKFTSKTKSNNHLRAAKKLVVEEKGRYRFRSDPPLLIPIRELPRDNETEQLEEAWQSSFDEYRSTLDDAVRLLLDRYRPVDAALKVVGVGSVGTRCSVILLIGKGANDPLLLQVKEATTSVLEEHLPPPSHENSGQRVVKGQRRMQAFSDVFLGWSRGSLSGSHFYWRQLKDWKGSMEVGQAGKGALKRYARLCGWTLARAQANTGDPGAIAGYLGEGTNFDRALAEFGVRYAVQNSEDHKAFVTAIEDGGLEAWEVK